MKPEHLISFGIVMALPQLYAHATQPENVPDAPNYCSRFVCLEIDRLSSGDTKVESTSTDRKTEVEIRNNFGVTRLVLNGQNSCNSTPVIRLKEVSGNYQGLGCLRFPSGLAVAEIKVTFSPKVLSYRGDNPVGFPLSGAWAVDEAPVSFWERGYSLRLGPATKFSWNMKARPRKPANGFGE